jgi:Ca-activated chloride channel family protein
MRKGFLLFVIVVVSTVCAIAQDFPVTQGTLNAFGKSGDLGSCPLKHTDVKVEISGFLSRVRVKQEFENNFNQPIEAVYTFPLSQNGAVDDMTMTVGSRTIKGKILKREDARQVYENAKSNGQTASLLDQQRPNIFTQSVANIMPNEKIVIEISYVETLKYEDGSYEFVFPMTVAPRYNPASLSTENAAKISPPIAATRAGHDISVEVNLDAGVPVESIQAKSHEVQSVNLSANSANIKLKDEKTIPNKDFVLRYDVTGKRIEDAILTHRDERGGFFTLVLSPPDKFKIEDVAPKEIVFVLDTSGSMSGFPIEKAKEAMNLSLKGLYPRDTFNLITFAGDTHILFEKPVPATAANLARAQEFLSSRNGGGGTEMMKAIKAALEPSGSNEHIRIVCFMTDGFVGNEAEILSEIQKNKNARVFSFGIGNSVNRFLLDKMAEEGNGESEIVLLEDESEKAAKKFYERVRTPLLTDISIDWNGLPVADVYPQKIADLFSAKPVILNGRYTKGASSTIKLKGKVGGQIFEREINVNLPESEPQHDVLATLWARKRIDELTSKSYADEKAKAESQNAITNIGLEFRLLTAFTSFVAVEERVVNRGGQPTKIEVPVELADGMSRENVSGEEREQFIENFWRRRDPAGNGGGQGSGNGSGNVISPIVNTTDASIGNNFQPLTVNSLPVNGRNFSSLLKIAPGVQPQPLSGGFSIDGSSGSENTFVVDGTEVTNFRTGTLNKNNKSADDDITSSVAKLPKPEIPQNLKWTKKDGLVNVEFSVNEKGDVLTAKAISGLAALKKPSETAALESKFSPPTFEGEPLRMAGVIVYNFVDSKTVEISLDKMRVELSPEIKRKLLLKQKLHFWLYDVVERLDKNDEKPTANEANFVFKGKAEIQVILTQNTPEIIANLKKAGLEIEQDDDVRIVGRIAIEKLAQLAEIEQVRYVSP